MLPHRIATAAQAASAAAQIERGIQKAQPQTPVGGTGGEGLVRVLPGLIPAAAGVESLYQLLIGLVGGLHLRSCLRLLKRQNIVAKA